MIVTDETCSVIFLKTISNTMHCSSRSRINSE